MNASPSNSYIKALTTLQCDDIGDGTFWRLLGKLWSWSQSHQYYINAIILKKRPCKKTFPLSFLLFPSQPPLSKNIARRQSPASQEEGVHRNGTGWPLEL